MKDEGWNEEQRRYFRQVKRVLKCSGKLRMQILGNLRAAMEDSPEADRAEMERRFGTPEQFVRNIQESMEPEQLAREQTAHMCRLAAVLVLALVILAGMMGFYARQCSLQNVGLVCVTSLREIESNVQNEKQLLVERSYYDGEVMVADIVLFAAFAYDGQKAWVLDSDVACIAGDGWCWAEQTVWSKGKQMYLKTSLSRDGERIPVFLSATCSPTGDLS